MADYCRNRSAPDGLQAYCRPCHNDYQRKYQGRHPRNNPATQRAYKLRREYGITVDQYNDMLIAQGGVCAICRTTCKTGVRLAVDHDHSTRRVRGLLCMNCNRAIGHLQDNAELAMRAANYLAQDTSGGF